MDTSDRPAPDSGSDADHELVVQCLDALQSGGTDAVEALLAQHPSAAPRLRERLAKLARAGLLPVPEDDPARIPESLGDHRLIRRLGSGGMGVVYLAEQTSLGRTVALKLVRPEQRFFPGARSRFRREVESIARLGDPGIVPIYVVGEDQGIDYFTMEYVRGATLGEVIAAVHDTPSAARAGRDFAVVAAARSGVTQPEHLAETFVGTWAQACCRVVARMARAAHHAHERGVVHRDLKPNNAMVTPDGRVLLLDFGLAAASGTDRITRSGAMLGTLHYMAPEQLGSGEVDARTDVYSLGVTLFELLAMRSPFAANDPERLRQQITTGAATPLLRADPDVPRDIAVVVAKAMDRDPGRRYPTAQALADDLERFLQHRPIQARPASTWTRTMRWGQRHPVALTAALLTVIATGAGTAIWQFVARQAEARLETEREHAHQNLRGAITALENMVSSARLGAMSRTPGLDDERLRQLDTAIAMIERLRRENPDDVDARRLFVHGMARAAEVHCLLGHFDRATALLDDADAAHAELPPPPAGAPPATISLSLGLVRATALVGLGRFREATTIWQRLLDETRHVALENAPVELLIVLGTCHNNLARMALSEQRADDGAALLARAIEIEQRIPPEQRTIDQQLDFVRSRMNLGSVHLGQGALDRAKQAYAAVAADLERLLVAHPDEPELRRESARCGFARARLATAGKDLAAAAAGRDAAIATMTELVAAFPGRVGYRQELGLMQIEGSSAALQAKDVDAAARLAALAVAGHETLLAQSPDQPEYRAELAEFLRHRSLVELATGREAEALASLARGITMLEEVVRSHAEDAHYRIALAALLQELGIVHARAERWNESRIALRAARDAYEAAVLAKHAPAMDPRRFPKLLMVLSQIELMCDDFDGVVAALGRLQEVQPMPRSALLDVGRNLHVDDRADFAELLEKAPPDRAPR